MSDGVTARGTKAAIVRKGEKGGAMGLIAEGLAATWPLVTSTFLGTGTKGCGDDGR